jgi:hypothetical protein
MAAMTRAEEIARLTAELERYRRLRAESRDPWFAVAVTALIEDTEDLLSMMRGGASSLSIFSPRSDDTLR